MAEFIDLTGQKIGRIKFLSYFKNDVKHKWNWICDCGNEGTYRIDTIKKYQKKGKIFECRECYLERKFPVILGGQYGRWTCIRAASPEESNWNKRGARFYLFHCECGNEKVFPISHLTKHSKASKSCGCLSRKLASKWVNTTQYPPKHGFKGKESDIKKRSIYHLRNNIVSKCYREESPTYGFHGALGEKVCDTWRNGATEFYKWALENKWEKGNVICLKEDKKIWCPENCYIMNKGDFFKKNNSKLIEYNGEIKSQTEWAQKLGCSQSNIQARLKRYPNSIEKALTLKKEKK